MPDPWARIVGQRDAVRTLRRAADSPGTSAMTHAWLITGPPGSGRSNLAFAFAAALLSPPGAIDEAVLVQVEARTHPDLVVLATEGVIISIQAARDAVQRSSLSPASSRHRVVVVEDAGHFSMFGVCKPGAERAAMEAEIEEPICSDGAGISRSAIHAVLIDRVEAAFRKGLGRAAR